MRKRFIKRVAVAERPQLDAGERQTRHGDGVTAAGAAAAAGAGVAC